MLVGGYVRGRDAQLIRKASAGGELIRSVVEAIAAVPCAELIAQGGRDDPDVTGDSMLGGLERSPSEGRFVGEIHGVGYSGNRGGRIRTGHDRRGVLDRVTSEELIFGRDGIIHADIALVPVLLLRKV